MPLFAWYLFLENINMNIVRERRGWNDKMIHSNIQNLLANKLELTLIKTANKNKNGFINKIYVHIMCFTYGRLEMSLQCLLNCTKRRKHLIPLFFNARFRCCTGQARMLSRIKQTRAQVRILLDFYRLQINMNDQTNFTTFLLLIIKLCQYFSRRSWWTLI